MLKRGAPFILLILVMVACSKDKFQTKPTIKIKNVSGNLVSQGQAVQVTLEFTDKEGDLNEGEVTYVRDRTNILPIPNAGSNDHTDTVRSKLPDFPKNSKGEIQVTIPYDGFMDEDPNDNDTMIFRFSVKDLNGNNSDTVATEKIVAVQN